jgi:hypothetical protein
VRERNMNENIKRGGGIGGKTEGEKQKGRDRVGRHRKRKRKGRYRRENIEGQRQTGETKDQG